VMAIPFWLILGMLSIHQKVGRQIISRDRAPANRDVVETSIFATSDWSGTAGVRTGS
jgi:hypothetical protein